MKQAIVKYAKRLKALSAKKKMRLTIHFIPDNDFMFLAANPDKAVQNVRKQVAKAISDVRKGGDLKKLNKLTQQLKKVAAIGGFKTIVPSEGIVFIYKGNTYKLTGAFAPVNQITGMMTF